MSDETKKIPLVTKLSQACDAVGGIAKKGRNEAQKYDYVKAADVAKAIRHELFTRGIVIIPNEIELKQELIETIRQDKSVSRMWEVTLKTEYVVKDDTESLTFGAYGIARDSGDKAIWKAKTGALKYFLRGLGLIPDEKDDPEFDKDAPLVDKKAEKQFKKEYEARTEEQTGIAAYQVNGFNEACAKTGKTETQIQGYLKSIGRTEVKEMTKMQFNDAIKWASGREEMLKTLNRSVAVAPKPLNVDKHNFAKLFAIAKSKNIPKEDVTRMGHEIYKVESLNDLTSAQFSGLLEWAENQEIA